MSTVYLSDSISSAGVNGLTRHGNIDEDGRARNACLYNGIKKTERSVDKQTNEHGSECERVRLVLADLGNDG